MAKKQAELEAVTVTHEEAEEVFCARGKPVRVKQHGAEQIVLYYEVKKPEPAKD